MNKPELTVGQMRHKYFDLLPVLDSCTWYGTEYDESGNILPCGRPTIGAAIFCDPSKTHIDCEYHSLCKEHKPSADWEVKAWA